MIRNTVRRALRPRHCDGCSRVTIHAGLASGGVRTTTASPSTSPPPTKATRVMSSASRSLSLTPSSPGREGRQGDAVPTRRCERYAVKRGGLSAGTDPLDIGVRSTEDRWVSDLWEVAATVSSDIGKQAELAALARVAGWSPEEFARRADRKRVASRALREEEGTWVTRRRRTSAPTAVARALAATGRCAGPAAAPDGCRTAPRLRTVPESWGQEAHRLREGRCDLALFVAE